MKKKRYGPVRNRFVYVHPSRGGGAARPRPAPQWYAIDAGQLIWTRRYLSGEEWLPQVAGQGYTFGCRLWKGGDCLGFLWGSTEIKVARERVRVSSTPPEGWPK